MKKMILALATAGALAAATALPAAATTIAVGDRFTAVNGVTWGGVENDYFNISDAETGSENDAFDGFGRFEWYVGEQTPGQTT